MKNYRIGTDGEVTIVCNSLHKYGGNGLLTGYGENAYYNISNISIEMSGIEPTENATTKFGTESCTGILIGLANASAIINFTNVSFKKFPTLHGVVAKNTIGLIGAGRHWPSSPEKTIC